MKSFGFSKFTLLDSIVSYKSTKNDQSTEILPDKKPKTLQSLSKVQPRKHYYNKSEVIEKSEQTKLLSEELEKPKKRVLHLRSRNQSVGAPSLNVYLEQIEIAKQNNKILKQDMSKVLMNVNAYVQQIKAEQKTRKYVPSKQEIDNDNKFKPIIFNNEEESEVFRSNQSIKVPPELSQSCLSEQSTTRKIQENHILNTLINIIKDFHTKFDLLRKLWQNDMRLEKFIRFQTSLKQDLQMVFFPDADTNQLFLSYHQLQKLFVQQKPSGEIYNCNAAYQLRDLTQAINKILEQQKFQELFDIKKSIQETARTIKELEKNKVIQKYAVKKDYSYLSFQSLLMSNEEKDKNLEKMEGQLGVVNKVSGWNRKMSQLINDTVHNLQSS